MGVKIENQYASQNRGNSNGGRRRNDEWTEAETYLNIGKWVTDPESGEQIFLSVAGIGIENIRVPDGLNSSNASFRARAEFIEQMRQALLSNGQDMKPGQSEPLEGFEFEIRKRKGQENPIPTDQNPFMQQASDLFARVSSMRAAQVSDDDDGETGDDTETTMGKTARNIFGEV